MEYPCKILFVFVVMTFGPQFRVESSETATGALIVRGVNIDNEVMFEIVLPGH